MDPALEGILQRFILRCASDLQVVREALEPGASASGGPLQVTVHRLRGAAPMVDRPGLGALAAEVDEELMAGRNPEPALLRRLEAALLAVIEP
jgi:HPt (histidine-containing phosphotransfer) domain-containing protein